jgi:hypothetical protein
MVLCNGDVHKRNEIRRKFFIPKFYFGAHRSDQKDEEWLVPVMKCCEINKEKRIRK